jgi:hypothetical protein
MKIVNSISGGQTSAYISANYKADYNVFALVRTNDLNCIYPDKKIRQIVSDKIGKEFIGTLEDDLIINTILDLEQFIGQKIDWVSGDTFESIIEKRKYLPNIMSRFCTTEMKLKPLFDWWQNTINDPITMQIGFRANEQSRAKNMLEKTNKKGLSEFKTIVGQSENGRNKWKNIEWQKPSFPLIQDKIFKDKIQKYWIDKPVRFAYMNNCIGCFHRNEILLKYMSEKHSNKFDWFCNQEEGNKTFKKGITYNKIKNHKLQFNLFEEDFNDCDSGYCGL